MQPQTPPPIKITITPDDFRDISNALKELAEDTRQRIGEAIRDQDLAALTAADRDFAGVVAYFAKITKQPRDKALIKRTFSLDDLDITYLIEKCAPADGIMNMITSYTITGKAPQMQAQDTPPAPPADEKQALKQGELFPDFIDTPPTVIVDYDEKQTHQDKANIAISKVSQLIIQATNKQLTQFRVSPRTAKKEVLTKVSLSLDLPDGAQISRPISFYDRVVEDAVANLFEQGFTEISDEMIVRQMNGLKDGEKVSKTAAGKAHRSMLRLAHTWISIDYTEQMRSMLKQPVEKAVIGDVVIPATNVYIKFHGGNVKSGWKIKGLPQIYNYSKIVRQIATIPTALLDTAQATRSTEEIIAARYYLITQIERIKRKPENNKILFDSLFEAIGDTEALEKTNSARVIRKRRIDAITAILEHFKTLQYITDFRITNQRGGKIDGVIITAPTKGILTEGPPEKC